MQFSIVDSCDRCIPVYKKQESIKLGQGEFLCTLDKNLHKLLRVLAPMLCDCIFEPTSLVADISKSMASKRKRLEGFTQASLKTSNKKVEEVWKTQQEERSVHRIAAFA